MKIVHILPALTKGGGERVAVDLANESARRGHEVTMVAAYPVDPVLLADRLAPQIALRFIADLPAGRLAKFRNARAWVRANWPWLAEQDVVHAHLTYGGYVAGLIRSRRRRLKAARPAVVETCHSVGMPVPKLKRAAWAWLSRNRDGLALMARDSFWDRFRTRHPAMASAVILNGVSAPRPVAREEVEAFRRALGLPDGARLVAGTIGMFRPERRPLVFAQIFARMADSLGPDTHFLLGGDGALMPQVRAAVAAAGMEGRIHLPGVVHEPAVALAALDLYVTLNVGAVTGIAALEAAMAGLPLVALQVIDDFSPSPDDWIWSSADPALVADHAVAILGDPDRLRAQAAAQQAHAEARHGAEAMARGYEAFYEAAIAGAGR